MTTLRWPFFSARAAERAPIVLSFAAVPGAAFLVSPSGSVAASAGAAVDVGVERVARACALLSSRRAEEIVSFRDGEDCVYVVRVGAGWLLCVMSTLGMAPELVRERTLRAAHVLRLALFDVPPPAAPHGGGGGAPATVSLWDGSRKLRRHGGE